MSSVNIHEAKTQRFKLVAPAVRGEPFIILHHCQGRQAAGASERARCRGSAEAHRLPGRRASGAVDFNTMGSDETATLFGTTDAQLAR